MFANSSDCRIPSKHEILCLCCFNVGPASTTLAQHWHNNATMSRVCWVPTAHVSNSINFMNPLVLFEARQDITIALPRKFICGCGIPQGVQWIKHHKVAFSLGWLLPAFRWLLPSDPHERTKPRITILYMFQLLNKICLYKDPNVTMESAQWRLACELIMRM